MSAATPPIQVVEPLAVETVGRWRQTCRRELERGGRFCGAHASGEGDGRRWTALFAAASRTRALSVAVGKRGVPTIVDLLPAADWDEREAHDQRGIDFSGRETMRGLVDHGQPTSSWTVPVRGEGTHQVAVGPVHAGVIESGHFRFHVVGERILHLDTRLFYKHRGLERAAEGCPPEAALALAQRACGACAVANSIAFAQACEGALGLVPARDLRRARTLLLELERLYNHLNDVAAICAGVGFAPGNAAFAALKERALRLNRELAGHRFLFGTAAVGASRLELSDAEADRVRGQLRELGEDFALAWREVAFSASVQARLDGVGELARADAVALGALGPTARASGLELDTRAHSPGLWYGASFAAAAPRRPTGDVAARLEMRAVELEACFELLADLLAERLSAAAAGPGGPAGRLGVGRVEGARGEVVCAVELAADRLARLRLRTASYANWPAVARASTDNLLPDFPLINKSFELCYACVDR